jgi:putative transposase
MKYQFIAEHQQEYEVKTMRRALTISESGYYAWKQRGTSRRELEDQWLIEQIQQAYQRGRQVYGSPRVAHLMQRAGLRAIHKRHRTITTDSQHTLPIAPNLLQRDFSASAPNTKWLTDITAIWTRDRVALSGCCPGCVLASGSGLGNERTSQ